jgi:hypothetical protein
MRPRIAIVLKGGLGNQLFQWAFARELRSRGASVSLEVSQLRADIGDQLLDLAPDIRRSSLALTGRRWTRRLGLSMTPFGGRLVIKNDLGFSPEILTRPGRWAVLDGYWQSEQYFPTVAQDLRAEVRAYCRSKLTRAGEEMLLQLSESNTVSLHVRRGDYVKDAAVNAFHGVLPMDYYCRALEVVPSTSEPRCFVFSDDLPWARKQFEPLGAVVVGREVAGDPAGELLLMAETSAHVIANSSFSWWGAWLDDRTQPTVIAPRKWFADPSAVAHDLIPRSWSVV